MRVDNESGDESKDDYWLPFAYACNPLCNNNSKLCNVLKDLLCILHASSLIPRETKETQGTQ